jgi:hypothetical protein
MKQITVLRSPSRGTNFYRIDNPMHFVKSDVLMREVYLPVENYIKVLTGSSALFVSMPTDKHALWLIMAARAMDIPVICDVDDLLTADYGEAYKDHLDCLDLATVIICATEELQDVYMQYNTVLIENFLDLKFTSQKRKSLRPTIVVRGSTARKEDYEHYQDMFVEIEQRLQPKWYFMGYTPTFFRPILDEVIPFSEPMKFFHKLCDINPHFIFHPIVDTPVGRCKSKSAYWEAALCNAQLVTTATWWKGENIITDVKDMALPVKPAVVNKAHNKKQIDKFKQLIYDYTSV